MAKNLDKISLVARCKNQEWAAQKELYLTYADEMMSIAIRYAKDYHSAKDLVQETFLTFFNKIDQFDESKGTVGAYISRILINHSFKEFRNRRKIIFESQDSITNNVNIDHSIIEQLEAEDILLLLKKLPEGCRVIFNLKEIEGYSHKEIGVLLNITDSASRSQLTRAKKMLRKYIEESEMINKIPTTYRT